MSRKEGIYRRKKRIMAFDPYTPAMHAALEEKKRDVYAALGRYKYWVQLLADSFLRRISILFFFVAKSTKSILWKIKTVQKYLEIDCWLMNPNIVNDLQ